MKKPAPVLLLEINEIPWRILNHYREQYPHIRAFFEDALERTTLTVDDGELSPWVTWPTFHRGLPNREHRVFNLGQDPSSFRGKPLWEEYRERGFDIGVFGSMQSWPARDPGQTGFYVPDTFAHDEKCIPSTLEPLQRFNLDQVAQNGRVVTSSPLKAAMKPSFILNLLKAGVRVKTLFRLAAQVVRERLNPDWRARRPVFQTVLFWDTFRHLYNPKNPPQFTTFFTNHVAGVMHRYWNHIFPQDFPQDLRPSKRVHHHTMQFAMDVLDEMMEDVLDWQKQNPELTVIFATSMGQGPIFRHEHHGHEAVVREIPVLFNAMGLSHADFEPLLAMAPQIAARVPDSAKRHQTKIRLESLTTASGQTLFAVQEIGDSLSVTLKNPSAADCAASMAKDSDRGLITFADLGIAVWQTDAGTAYHIPEGIFAVRGPMKSEFEKSESKIPADRVKHLMMSAAGLSEVEYGL